MKGPRTMNRRDVMRLFGGAGLALTVPLVLPSGNAEAGIGWCRADPVIRLSHPNGSGNTASIYLVAQAEQYVLNNSSGDIMIEHPKDAKTDKLWEDPNGYFGQGVSTNFAIGNDLQFGSGYMDVRVRCYIPASSNDMLIRLEWAPGPIQFVGGNPLPAVVTASAEGRGNQWISLTSRLPYA